MPDSHNLKKENFSWFNLKKENFSWFNISWFIVPEGSVYCRLAPRQKCHGKGSRKRERRSYEEEHTLPGSPSPGDSPPPKRLHLLKVHSVMIS